MTLSTNAIVMLKASPVEIIKGLYLGNPLFYWHKAMKYGV